MSVDLEQLTKDVITLAKEVGFFIKTEASKFERESIEYKGVNDMVSYVDKTAEQQIVRQLSLLLPEAGFITEEKTINKTGIDYTWIVDPLDGTTNFIHGIPTFSVSIALQKHDQLVLGVVYEINRDECFYAWKDGGAYLNEKPISVSQSTELSQTLLATGFPYYDFVKQAPYLEVFKDLMQKCHGLRRIGSAAVDMAYVACGRFDGYFEYNINSYDIAAGMVLIQEAGGEILDFSGKKEINEIFTNREVVATNKKISAEILQIIEKHFS